MILFVSIMTFIAMEYVAWATHKYVMHGFLWKWHLDHHQPHKKTHKFLEKNDLFFLVFAFPGIACSFSGFYLNAPILTGIGIGITIYGFAYFMVHDLYIHRRVKIFKSNSENRYLKGIRKGHKIHHKNIDKESGECFGMLLVPYKYFRK